jgi:hypothetical protein
LVVVAKFEELKAEMVVPHTDKKVLEEQYLTQIIAVGGRTSKCN